MSSSCTNFVVAIPSNEYLTQPESIHAIELSQMDDNKENKDNQNHSCGQNNQTKQGFSKEIDQTIETNKELTSQQQETANISCEQDQVDLGSSSVKQASNSKYSEEEDLQDQILLPMLDSDCSQYKNENKVQDSQISTDSSYQLASRSTSSKSGVKTGRNSSPSAKQQHRWLSWQSQVDSGQNWVANASLGESARQSTCSVSCLSSSSSSSVQDMESSLVSFRSGLEGDSEGFKMQQQQQLLTGNILLTTMKATESYLHGIKEEAESDTTSMCSSSVNVVKKETAGSGGSSGGKEIKERTSSVKSNWSLYISSDSSSDSSGPRNSSLPSRLSNSNKIARKLEKLRMILGEKNITNEESSFTLQIHEVSAKEEQNWSQCESDYSLQKRMVFRASSKLLQTSTLAQKYPIFSAGQSTSSQLSELSNNPLQHPSRLIFALEGSFRDSLQIEGSLKSPSVTETPRVHRRTTLANMTLGALTFWPNFYISSQDNALFHLYWKPQKSLHDVLHSLKPDGLICQQTMFKKIPGIIDRWKKKVVSLFIDRIEYHKPGNNPKNLAFILNYLVHNLLHKKDSFRHSFSLQIESSGNSIGKKKYTFKCTTVEENTFWIETIVDVMLINEAYCKFQLFPVFSKLYEKKRVCSAQEISQTLKTGDIFYFSEEQEDSNAIQIGFVVRTSFLIQVCYLSPEEETLASYPLDTFLSLANLQLLRFRSLQGSSGETLSKSEQSKITYKGIQFIKEQQETLFHSSYQLVSEIMSHCNIIKSGTSLRSLHEENLSTGKLDQYLQGYSYSENISLILDKHVKSIQPAPFEIHSLLQDTNSVSSELVSFCCPKVSPCLSPLILSEPCQIPLQSLNH